MTAYVYPHFGDVPVASVATAHVLAALQPIWLAKPETAVRVRGRMEAVLDYARSLGLRAGENPARWKGHLSNTLPARGKVAPVEHHAALPWAEVGGFLAALRTQPGIAARALEFAILTAARTGEVLGARWGEVDLQADVWTVPAAPMKAGKEHRVPLAAAPAVSLLRELLPLRDAERGDFVFPGGNEGKPLSIMAMTMTMRRMQRSDLTAHGFRSTFRDWTAETTGLLPARWPRRRWRTR
jgi:integrase